MDKSVEAAETLELSVVMPCLNERETVGVCVRKALASLHEAGIRGEVIVGPACLADPARHAIKLSFEPVNRT